LCHSIRNDQIECFQEDKFHNTSKWLQSSAGFAYRQPLVWERRPAAIGSAKHFEIAAGRRSHSPQKRESWAEPQTINQEP